MPITILSIKGTMPKGAMPTISIDTLRWHGLSMSI